MNRQEILQLVSMATDELEGKVKEIDKATDWVYHSVLYSALDALERASEHLNEGENK